MGSLLFDFSLFPCDCILQAGTLQLPSTMKKQSNKRPVCQWHRVAKGCHQGINAKLIFPATAVQQGRKTKWQSTCVSVGATSTDQGKNKITINLCVNGITLGWPLILLPIITLGFFNIVNFCGQLQLVVKTTINLCVDGMNVAAVTSHFWGDSCHSHLLFICLHLTQDVAVYFGVWNIYFGHFGCLAIMSSKFFCCLQLLVFFQMFIFPGNCHVTSGGK